MSNYISSDISGNNSQIGSQNETSSVETRNGERTSARRRVPRRWSTKKAWSRETLIARILELHAQGVDLSPTSIQHVDSALFSSARSSSHFGSWRSAIEECGLDYECIKRVQQRWSREFIVDQIKELHAQGENLLDPDCKARHRNLYLAACAHRYFGSWRRALIEAGLDHEVMREERVWTRARIQRTIQELSAHGENLSWSHVEAQCPGIYRAARRPENFGSWKNALASAGVIAKPERRGRPLGSIGSSTKNKRIVEELTQASDANLDMPLSPVPDGDFSTRDLRKGLLTSQKRRRKVND